ncbi:NAD(P)-dependent oxidoreductase, partial [Paludibacterium sp.]|uniref:NAD(P)-dependent oxidoreductase n=1 Tax=Paludibacterium sp. TaxID=1917523 RepID=UPI0025FF9B67
ANAQAVAEYVLATAMLLRRGALGVSRDTAAGNWPRQALAQGREIRGARLGLIGFGSIGQLTARLARALGMEVRATDPALDAGDPVWRGHGVDPIGLDALLAQSDVVSLHLPLTVQTRQLIGRAQLSRLKPGAVLINTSRGGIVDEAALAAALKCGTLGGAALDVFEQEPLPAGTVLSGVPNLLLTPHIAGVTRESNVRVSDVIAQAVAAALRNQGERHGLH